MYYSKPKKEPGRQPDNRAEWICGKCGTNNFKRREFCYKCNFSREGSEGDGFDHVGNNPCNTLIFRGLDALTTEENIVLALGRVSTLPVKNIKVIRDELTGTSRSYGFVELSSLSHATQVVDTITQSSEPFEVDGKAIIVAYAKNTFTTVMATLSQPKQYAQPDYSSYYQQEGAAGYYDQNGQYYDYSAYYNYAQTDASQPGTQTDITNAAAAVAQAAIQQAQAAKQYQHEIKPKVFAHIQQQPKLATAAPEETPQPVGTQPQGEYQKYPVPDVSTYQYDESSGYYYDPATGLYYDANSQYYYNSQTGQFLYWDGGKETYLPAPTEQQQQPAPDCLIPQPQPQPQPETTDKKDDDQKTKKDKEKKEKVKVAKKIAKDMEKWAKTLNARKDAMKDVFRKTMPAVGTPILAEKEAAIADVGYAVLEKRAIADLKGPDAMGRDVNLMMPPPSINLAAKQNEPLPSLVASYEGENDSEEETEEGGARDDVKLVDLAKMACLLCKRQFPNKEALTRHTQLSDLHKKNLDDYLESQGPSEVPLNSIQYRDRAKERRDKYGTPEPPLPKKAARAAAAEIPIPFEQPTQAGIGQDNIGNKLLQKMGWSEGQGLGKQGQGIVDPVQATRRQAQAGLGARGSRISNSIPPGSTYRETGKKMMFARYHELEDTV